MSGAMIAGPEGEGNQIMFDIINFSATKIVEKLALPDLWRHCRNQGETQRL
ncbi:hypothetical protein [Pararhodobacter marinus]|uniref:hypothetical protein n=1 Tax=Pararhodobacter marinus TaxID=2184063 RepID=UPI0035181603